MSDNPYAPPKTTATANAQFKTPFEELAGRFTRFAAAMVDGFLLSGIVEPIKIAMDYTDRVRIEQVGLLEEIAISLLAWAVFLLLNGYLLYSRGQTIGKLLTKIQIVDVNKGSLLPFMKVCVLRYYWLLPFALAVVFIPGLYDDYLLLLISLIDTLLIFGVTRRCLHDYFAGSHVVLYREDRPRL